jgi:hypothetical protein
VHDGFLDPDLTFSTNEANSNLSGGCVNSHKNRHWSRGNPQALIQLPSHGPKIGEWCAVSANRVIAPTSQEGARDAVRYGNVRTRFSLI